MIPVYLEVGSKRVFAVAVEWPGWARAARDEAGALEALEGYAARFAPVASAAGLAFEVQPFEVVERLTGDATTDFGAPGKVPDLDRRSIKGAEAARQAALLAAAWAYFDRVVAGAPASLRKGPRGGGRDTAKVVEHVRGAEESYARKVGLGSGSYSREAVLEALRRPAPALPAGEKGWPPRYLARRMAWHVLDHAWEIEDRSSPEA